MSDDDEVLLWKGDFTADETRSMARAGTAMSDGSFPVPDAAHLEKAIHAVGRGTNNSHAAIRKHIIQRARALGLSSKIPDSWGADGTITKAETVELAVPMWKNDDQQLVYGVVLTPGLEDSQGDIASAPEIQQAAHRFLVEFRKHDVQHTETEAPIQTVESFIAPTDMVIEGEKVLKGAWVLAAKVNDSSTWERVRKGELTGWSIGGSGVREPIPVA